MHARNLSFGWITAITLASLASSGCQSGGPSGDAGSCDAFVAGVCAKAGENTAACAAARQATDVLVPAACAVALQNVDAALEKLAAARGSCNTLMERLCKDIGAETDSCAMVREKTPQFPVEQCDKMLSQYDGVLGELQRAEEAKKPLDEEKQKAIAATDAPSFGPVAAKVTLVEFSDFECPYCSKAASVTTALKKKYADQVRFVFRQFPLSFHKNAHLAAQASLAAHAQGKFWEFHDLTFANQQQLDRESLEKNAATLGLDMNAFKRALDQKTHAAAVDADQKLGATVAVSGTPTLFLNGARIANPTDLDMVAKAIDAALAVN